LKRIFQRESFPNQKPVEERKEKREECKTKNRSWSKKKKGGKGKKSPIERRGGKEREGRGSQGKRTRRRHLNQLP